MTPNWVGILVFVAWPLVAASLYISRTRAEATVWTILGGLLIMPEGVAIKFQMVPALDKTSIPNLCALVGCIFSTQVTHVQKRRFGICELLLFTFVLSPIVTAALNGDPISAAGVFLPGVGYYDGISTALNQFLLILSFYVGRRYLRDLQDTATILRALVLAGLVYSLPILFEIRMSPQLSLWLYGFIPSFGTEFRYGGFRPCLFM